MKPRIKAAEFGSITVGKKIYRHDIVIGLDGQVRKRKKKLSKRLFGTSHRISLDEIMDIHEQGAKQLIVGTGHYSQVGFSEEAREYLQANGCNVVLSATPEAMSEWNNAEEHGTTIGLFHVTC
jgi:hypothetical protein